MFISEAIASQGSVAMQNSSMSVFFTQMILVFAIFYFILIRPQQKKMKEHENMLNAIQPKDEVITGGGIKAKVVKADAETLTVEIAKGVEVVVTRSSIREVISDKK